MHKQSFAIKLFIVCIPFQMPFFSYHNATLHESKCHTWMEQMPFISLVEVWHLGHWGVALWMMRCGILKRKSPGAVC